MARIWLSEILNDIRGSVKNHVYSVWKGLNYIREKAVSIANPSSIDQANMRAKTSATSKRWYSTLTVNQRALWNEYAEALAPIEGDAGGTKNIIPQSRNVMSGYNAYIMLNCLGYSADAIAMGGFVDDAPIGQDPPNQCTNLVATWNGATCEIDLTWVDPIDIHGATGIRIWLVSLDAGVHKQIVLTAVPASQAASIGAVKVANGAPQNIEDLPGHYHIQIDAVGPFGQKGPPSITVQPIVPANCTPA